MNMPYPARTKTPSPHPSIFLQFPPAFLCMVLHTCAVCRQRTMLACFGFCLARTPAGNLIHAPKQLHRNPALHPPVADPVDTTHRTAGSIDRVHLRPPLRPPTPRVQVATTSPAGGALLAASRHAGTTEAWHARSGSASCGGSRAQRCRGARALKTTGPGRHARAEGRREKAA